MVSDFFDFSKSIDNSITYSACTGFDNECPSYQIYFPYDTFYAENINYTMKDTRFPSAIKIQGFNQKNQIIDIIPKLEKEFCTLDEQTNNCKGYTSHIIPIPVQLYKGFKITMLGKDNLQTYQLCVGSFEIEGIIVHLPSKIAKCIGVYDIYIYILFLDN